jgi:hypothetical protein
MTLTTRDEFMDAMANNFSRIAVAKGSLGSQSNPSNCSLWRATGTPGQGAVPTSAAVCDHTLTGALPFTQQTSPAESYLSWLEGQCGAAGQTLEIHDRLMHMGGLSGTVTTSQTVNLDLDANLATANLAERIGESDYSDVAWWLEWYTATGGVASNATINVTYNDGSSGNLTVTSIVASRPASHMIPLNSWIPAADSGKYIRDVNNITLSVTTTTAGNFGVTATRFKGSIYMPTANARFKANWADLGLAKIPNSACLAMIMSVVTSASNVLTANGKIAHG